MPTLNTIQKSKSKKDFGREAIEVLFMDEWICVINKPTGLLTCPYPGSRARTAEGLLEEYMRKNGTFNANHRPFVVHRLDRDTSGVMMFALTETAQKKIMDSWHQMVTERLYHAVAENPKNKSLILPKSGLIDDELAFNSHNVGFVPKEGDRPKHKGEKDSLYERHIEGHGENRRFKTVPARTNYKVVAAGPTHTLFELSLDTGKKNQIRAHLASKGYPLAGDENYRARTDNFGRLCLHARTLEFEHPFTHEPMKFEVPEPEEWLEYVKKGDFKPKTPVWIEAMNKVFGSTKGEHFHSRNSRNPHEAEPLNLGKKRLTQKDRAHMNFIEAGKRKSSW